MAKLRVIQSISNDNYTLVFTIDADSLSDDDIARVKKFGAPSIDFGGDFTDGASITYTLPHIYFDLPTDFPVTQTFSIVSPSPITSVDGLTLYRTTIETRITTALTTLRAATDGFTGEYITNI